MNEFDFNEYNKKYLQSYGNYTQKTYLIKFPIIKSLNKKNFIHSVIFLSVPIFFTFFFDFFSQNYQYNQTDIVLNSNQNDYDEYIYEGRIISEIKKNKTIKESSLLVKNLKTSKFDEIIEQYKANLLKKDIPYQEDENPSKSISINNLEFAANINDRKKNFIKTVLPLSIAANQKIIIERKKLLELGGKLIKNKTLIKKDQLLLEKLASKYSVKTKNIHKIDIVDELLLRVEIIPNSIVLAQAANESGWGSSRFAREYNALFGEYTYNKALGTIPMEREEGKKHLIKHFSSFDQSVNSYFININTHTAYEEFRKIRSIQRKKLKEFNVDTLLNKLDVYAEDIKYIDTINSIIRVNKMKEYDNIQSLITIL